MLVRSRIRVEMSHGWRALGLEQHIIRISFIHSCLGRLRLTDHQWFSMLPLIHSFFFPILIILCLYENAVWLPKCSKCICDERVCVGHLISFDFVYLTKFCCCFRCDISIHLGLCHCSIISIQPGQKALFVLPYQVNTYAHFRAYAQRRACGGV